MTKISHDIRSTQILSADFVSSISINVNFKIYAVVFLFTVFCLFQRSLSPFFSTSCDTDQFSILSGSHMALRRDLEEEKNIKFNCQKADNTFPDIDPVSNQFRFKHLKPEFVFCHKFLEIVNFQCQTSFVSVLKIHELMCTARTMSHGTSICWFTWFERYQVSLTILQTHCWVGPSEVTELYFLSGSTSFHRCQYIFHP